MPFVPSSRKRRSSLGTLASSGAPAGQQPGGARQGSDNGRSSPTSGSPRPHSGAGAGHPLGANGRPAFGSTVGSDAEDDLPLSLSFLRRPSRSESVDASVDIERIMRQNTLLNAHPNGADSAAAATAAGASGAPAGSSALLNEEPTSPVSYPGSPASENLEDPRYTYTHPLVRKKSGELVKSSLRLPRLGSSRSLPATPTYKQVHFGVSPDVRYFKQKDKPTSVSADNSPFGSDNEDEYGGSSSGSDSGSDSDSGSCSSSSSDDEDAGWDYGADAEPSDTSAANRDAYACCHSLYQVSREYVEHSSLRNLDHFRRLIAPWQLDESLFPTVSYQDEIDTEVPVFLENCHLNADKTVLQGRVAVKNISYSKAVTVRYTFDDWNTVVNIRAQYTENTSRLLRKSCYDRFLFNISVPAMFAQYLGSHKYKAKIEPTFFCCIRYVSGGQEYWDNNYNRNYTLRFVRNGGRSASRRHRMRTSTRTSRKEPAAPGQQQNKQLHREQPKAYDSDNQELPIPRAASEGPQTPLFSSSPFSGTMASPGTPAVLREDKHGMRDNFETDDPLSVFSLDPQSTNTPPVTVAAASAKSTNTPAAAFPDAHRDSAASLNENTPIASLNKDPSTPDRSAQDEDTKPDVGSESYQDLLNKYCFFKSPSTVSSFLENGNEPMMGNHHGFY